jgi:NMD protein affecting ribosome stability and mRNA decay
MPTGMIGVDEGDRLCPNCLIETDLTESPRDVEWRVCASCERIYFPSECILGEEIEHNPAVLCDFIEKRGGLPHLWAMVPF